MKNNVEKAKEILEKYNQKDTLELMEGLDEKQKEVLSESVLDVDFDYLMSVYNQTTEEKNINTEGILPMNATIKENLTTEERNNYFYLGKQVIEIMSMQL